MPCQDLVKYASDSDLFEEWILLNQQSGLFSVFSICLISCHYVFSERAGGSPSKKLLFSTCGAS